MGGKGTGAHLRRMKGVLPLSVTGSAVDAGDARRVHLGLAPVNWNNDDVPEWGQTVSYAGLVAMTAGLGYDGIEAGTGAPEAPAGLRALLQGHGLRLPGAYQWVTLSDPARVDAEMQAALAVAQRLAAAGAETLLVAEHWTQERRAVAGRAAEHPELALSADALACLCRSLDTLGRRVQDLGLRLALHPHVGTPVETPAEVLRVMEATDPQAVGLCLDTGHTVYGGGDALAAAQRYAARVVYVHAKDVDAEALADARDRGMGLLDGLRRGVFSPVYATAPQRSTVDIDAVGAVLRKAGFGGWVIHECDRNPRAGDPAAEAEGARERLGRAFGRG